MGKVKETDERTVSWTWLDNNSDAMKNFHVAVAEGARAPSDREMESMPVHDQGSMDFSCSLQEVLGFLAMQDDDDRAVGHSQEGGRAAA